MSKVRYALRQFRLSPIFTATAILTLALGIGGTTAIFTLIHAVMIRSLPVVDPSRLYRIGEGEDCCVNGGPAGRWGLYSYPLFERLKAAAPEFEEVTAFQAGRWSMSVRRGGLEAASRPLRSEYVSGNYFQVFGVQPFAGRLLTPDDDRSGAPPVAVLSHRVWQLTYGADPSVLGATFFAEGKPLTVIGVAPPGFFGETIESDPPEIWIPLQQEPMIAGESSLLHQAPAAWLRAIGRVKPGANIKEIGARLTVEVRNWLKNDSGYPSNYMPEVIKSLPEQFVNITPAGSGVALMKDEYGESLQVLLGVCGVLLLIACANVANLLLARAVTRRSQTAVRMAIGATRREIVGEALTESILLGVGGGIAGLVVAVAAARLLLRLSFSDAHFVPVNTAPSLMVLGFAVTVALITGVIFGAAPAWLATRTDPAEALRGAGRGTSDRSSFARKALLVVQATLSVVLVAGATMLARSLNKLENQNFGFQVPGKVVVTLHNPAGSHTIPQLNATYRQLESELDRLPGVRGSGLALYNPLTDNWSSGVIVAGHPDTNDGHLGASWDRVSTDYLANFGIPLVRGRGFRLSDNETSEPIAVVNQAFVKRFFKEGEDPLDQHFGLDLPENATNYRIVGVVGDAKFAGWGLRSPARPMFYTPLQQGLSFKNQEEISREIRSHHIGAILLATNTPPGQLEPLVAGILAQLDPDIAITSIRTMQQQVELTFDQERAVASLAGVFGIIALVLAAIGLYGVTAYSVAQRTNEIGLRMALGADKLRVIGLVLHGAFRRVLIGLAIGVPLAIGAGKLIASQLYDVRFWDPVALTVAIGALALCSFFAAILPAGRAASIDPMRALRIE